VKKDDQSAPPTCGTGSLFGKRQNKRGGERKREENENKLINT
jgi:hypothetical protein